MIFDKRCGRCRDIKSAGNFPKNRSAKDGLGPWCKSCKRDHYQANRETVLVQCAQYREANREQRNAQKRAHHAANRDRLNAAARQYRADHAQELREGAIRRYREGGRPIDMPWPDRSTIAYSTAHQRVRATFGAAKNHLCSQCGKRAFAWSYDHSDPSPLFHQGVGLWEGKRPVPYSPDPRRYDPMCRSCHVKRDSYGAI